MKQYETPITLVEIIEVKYSLLGTSDIPVNPNPTEDDEAEESKLFNFSSSLEDF